MTGISIITICFNNLSDLQKTCASVDGQEKLPEEHWIIDGSTNDEILNWLQNNPGPAYRKWIHERDAGIYDAMNKGISRASQEIVHILNSGDNYASADVIAEVVGFFDAHPDIQWISGNIQMIRGGEAVIVGKPFEVARLYRGMRSVSHPTWFVKKKVYERTGPYQHLKIAGDYDMMCRIAGEPYAYLNKTVAIFDDSGVSSSGYLASLKESRQVFESHFGFSLKLVLWQWRLRMLHYLLQTSFGKSLFAIKKKAGLENM
ncbi:MAG: hypothetical protein RLZZ28_830 [Bacteroidota bacterium]|jgi:glycosyltransferase involved in cell wall biosynthesis